MTILFKCYETIVPHGTANAISATRLAELCGCTTREIRRAVELLRRQGVLICSSCDGKGGGYYLPENDKETAAYLGRQLSRIGNIWAALRPFKEHLRGLPIDGQLALDELAETGDTDG